MSNQSTDTGLILYVRDLLLLEAMRLACLRQYESVEQAQQVKKTLRDQLNSVLHTCSDAMYPIWRDWKVLLIEAIEQQEETLPHVLYIRRAESLPALLLAYQLYEDIGREADILTRNRIAHPSFCPIDADMEVLSQ